MAQYRKKPVVIEATQWFRNGDHPEDRFTPEGVIHPDEGDVEGQVVRYFRRPDVEGISKCGHCQKSIHEHGWVDTVQGGHIVCPGDWIITDDRVERSKHGHFYPCKPDIFEATYEKVES
jgi:hypothetical protein